jgi:hypothetical protein
MASPAFRTLPFLSNTFSSSVGQAQTENQSRDLDLFKKRVSLCCHVFTSNSMENFNNQVTAFLNQVTLFGKACFNFEDTTLENIKLSVIKTNTFKKYSCLIVGLRVGTRFSKKQNDFRDNVLNLKKGFDFQDIIFRKYSDSRNIHRRFIIP